MLRLAMLMAAAFSVLAQCQNASAQGDFIGAVLNHAVQMERDRQIREQQERDQQAARRTLEGERAEAERRSRATRLEEKRAEAENLGQRALDEQRAVAEQTARQAAVQLGAPARQLLSDAAEYVRLNPAHPKLLGLLEDIESLNSALRDGSGLRIENSMRKLSTELQQDREYRQMLNRRAEKQREESARRLGDTILQSQRQRNFIVSHMTNNPTSPQVRSLLPLIKDIDENAKDRTDFAKLAALTERVDLELRRLNLFDQFSQAVSQASQQSQTLIGQDALTAQTPTAAKPFASVTTAKNRFLLEGSLGDFVVMFNSSSSAPHVARNLRGEVVFEGGEASACLYNATDRANQIALLRRAIKPFKLQKLEIAPGACAADKVGEFDLVASERGSFLKAKLEYALSLVKEIEAQKVSPLLTIAEADIKALSDAEAAERTAVERDMEQGNRTGYGIVVVDNQSTNLCLAVKEAVSAHRRLLLGSADQLIEEMGRAPTMAASSPEASFISVQRQQCGAVYASADDLKSLISGFRKVGITFRASIVWVAPEAMEKAVTDAAREQAEQEQQALAIKRDADERAKLLELQGQEATKSKAARQHQLQAANGKTAFAAAAEIAADVRAGMDNIDGGSEQASRAILQFPDFYSWFRLQLKDRWELISFNSAVSDYGISDFKTRDLQTAYTSVTVRLSNRILGDYKNACFIFSRENDPEFKVQREPFVTSCDKDPTIRSWKRAHGFRSQWLAE